MPNRSNDQSNRPDPMDSEKPPGVEGGTGDVASRRAANPDGVGRPNDPPKKVNLDPENRTGHERADELGEP